MLNSAMLPSHVTQCRQCLNAVLQIANFVNGKCRATMDGRRLLDVLAASCMRSMAGLMYVQLPVCKAVLGKDFKD